MNLTRMRQKHTTISTRETGRVRSSCAYAYVVGVLTCFSADYAYAYACAYAIVKTSLKINVFPIITYN